ncbi:GerAB/ArcD/ProY family transporter [Paenibacillus sp. CF384]|uniref:GerAB/ArcD/ProY family transporter n=1 Tax=Paenibacillus sp. CF384 TaxID=1884382 RepID=UPI00089963E3|nr:GerAB/ArcD/ProY family transporter [Paenibacillus sp. CF384]SDX38800.1 spore germination protein (amino acid permease) [Paenibacillus sp. CF384]
MKEKSLGFWPVFMMLTLSVGLSSHVVLLPTVLEVSSRDAWMCGIIAFVVLIPWATVFITGTMKRTKQINLRQWLRTRLSPFGAWVLISPVIVLLLHTSFQSFLQTTSWTSSTYLPETPQLVVMICFMILIGFAVWNGLRAIAYMSCLLLPGVVFLGDFVMSVNMPNKNYALLLPMAEHGWGPPLHGAVYAVSCLMELFMLLFIQHFFSGVMKNWQLLLQLGFIMLLMLGPAVGAITEFGPEEADKLLYPAFAQWRLVSIGKYVEHVDFFAIYQWMSGAFVRISLGMALVLELIPLRKPKARLIFIVTLSLIYIVLGKILLGHLNAAQTIIQSTFIMDIGIVVFVTTWLWLLSFKGVPKEGGLDENAKQRAEAGAANNL